MHCPTCKCCGPSTNLWRSLVLAAFTHQIRLAGSALRRAREWAEEVGAAVPPQRQLLFGLPGAAGVRVIQSQGTSAAGPTESDDEPLPALPPAVPEVEVPATLDGGPYRARK